jgi:hypothetical protein
LIYIENENENGNDDDDEDEDEDEDDECGSRLCSFIFCSIPIPYTLLFLY